jgi:hypothetical protein
MVSLVIERQNISQIILCTWYGHWFWLRIFPIYLTGLTDFNCKLFRSHNFDTDFTTNIWIWSGAHVGCDLSAEDAYSF